MKSNTRFKYTKAELSAMAQHVMHADHLRRMHFIGVVSHITGVQPGNVWAIIQEWANDGRSQDTSSTD